MMDENKRAFVSAIETALIMYSRIKLTSMKYNPHDEAWGGLETVDIRFASGHRKIIDVTADSCLALMKDIARALS